MTEAEVLVDEDEFRTAGEAQRKKLRELVVRLRREPFLGNRIRRKQIPRAFRGLPNLFRLELPDGWKALYTVASQAPFGSQLRIVWIGDHKRYERLFGYD
ncbi:MAG: hypothetical protein E6K05_06615 [Methanobacteriota archaeon]|nr:MAG: hypothetical protein E6K05_06615 [Euryarchaeota archaeon]